LLDGQMRLGAEPTSGPTEPVISGFDIDTTGWFDLQIPF
jgi:hypothetical protein